MAATGYPRGKNRGPDEENPLFSSVPSRNREPLASRMRPRTLEEFVGQDHILGPGRLLRRAIQADRLSSLILYGPPGTGKTTLARVIANTTESHFLSLNAVLSGVKEVRESIEMAQRNRELYGRRTILFVDEVHRWNKAQQDALLPWVENGTVILIGATTENPFFEVISALVSRSRVFQLKPLSAEDLRTIAYRALQDAERGYGRYRVRITEDALEHLIRVSDGDARNLLNALELAVETTPPRFPPPEGEEIRIDRSIAEESIQRRAVLYDKEGDYHYDTISAFIKSLRGSDPDAALYWMARMIRAGEDPHFIFRRMLILAGEDVGLADPMALVVVEAAARAFDRVGMPEGQYHLAEAALYLATCPKSNSSLGYFDALKAVEEEGIRDVPSHLKDSSRDAVGFGHGQGYKYPHAYREHWVAQNYLPPELKARVFYQPGSLGYEGRIREEVLRRREAQLTSVLEEWDEAFTFSPQDRSRDEWLARTLAGGGRIREKVRKGLFERASPRRHERILLLGQGAGFLLPEAIRRVPEGWVWAVVPRREDRSSLERLIEVLPEVEKPRILDEGELASLEGDGTSEPSIPRFDVFLGRGVLTGIRPEREPLIPPGPSVSPSPKGSGRTPASNQKADPSRTDPYHLLAKLIPLLSGEGSIVLAEPVLEGSSRLFSSFQEEFGFRDLPPSLQEKLLEGEERYYRSIPLYLTAEQRESFRNVMEEWGLSRVEETEETFEEERQIQERNIEDWFGELWGRESSSSRLSLASVLLELLDPEELHVLSRWLKANLPGKRLPWKSRFVFLAAQNTSSRI
ncbi:MAG: AAA family ATPase [Spirochaetales bacterium]